ncbi:helix-turn-helix transcriptional regulator [Rubrobacter indicoceani]|uniref:helix-turn-helix transcriptional regulator n=1 Tax=Rubrobacter indicoceani TaxID=2051957 RepID=UPI000E5ACAD6|nr:WYL domain-containing protein [Rubrobacter indicoceani]
MSGVRPEPLAIEITLAHYVASMPEGKSVPLSTIAREFGCSVADVRSAYESVADVEDRDMTTIAGVFLTGEGETHLEKSAKGGYETDFRRPVRLSPVQTRAALLALDLVSGAQDPGILESVRGKIRTSAVPDVPEVEVGRIFDDDIPVVAAIEQARQQRRIVEIRYPSGREIKTREVEPLLMSSIEGVWYLNAYCRFAEAGRLFRLERILSARLTEERFTERADIEVKTDFAGIDPRRYAATRARIRFSPTVARWMEERPELDLIEARDDGSADYALHYTDPAWAAKRVLQYLGEAVVVEPEKLREEVRRMAESLLEAYRRDEA